MSWKEGAGCCRASVLSVCTKAAPPHVCIAEKARHEGTLFPSRASCRTLGRVCFLLTGTPTFDMGYLQQYPGSKIGSRVAVKFKTNNVSFLFSIKFGTIPYIVLFLFLKNFIPFPIELIGNLLLMQHWKSNGGEQIESCQVIGSCSGLTSVLLAGACSLLR